MMMIAMLNILLVSISRGGRLNTIAFGGGGRNLASLTRGSCNAKNIFVTSSFSSITQSSCNAKHHSLVTSYNSLRDIIEESSGTSDDGYFRIHSDTKDRSTSLMTKKQQDRDKRNQKKSLVDKERGFRPSPSTNLPEYAQVRNHRDVGDYTDPMRTSNRISPQSLVQTEVITRPIPTTKLPEYMRHTNHRDVGDTRQKTNLKKTSLASLSLVGSEGRIRPIPTTKVPEYTQPQDRRSPGDVRRASSANTMPEYSTPKDHRDVGDIRKETLVRRDSSPLGSLSGENVQVRNRPVPRFNNLPDPPPLGSLSGESGVRYRPVPRFANSPPSADNKPSQPVSSSGEAVKPVVKPKIPSVDVITISDAYDSGNGEIVSARIITDDDDDCDLAVNVKIKPDPYTDLEQKQHFQSFNFRATLNHNSKALKGIFGGLKSIKVKYILENAGEASYAAAFKGYSTFVSTKANPYDSEAWERTSDCEFNDNGQLIWTHVHSVKDGPSSAYFSYFPPYSYERHLDLIAKCEETEGVSVKSLGQTISGKEIDYITVGSGPRVCWINHRQHPGESMASFYAEGLLNRLCGLDGKWDKVAEKARELYTFYVVPNINPDGSASGYLRTNGVGSNLNREWCPSPAPMDDGGDDKASMYEAPTLERSPEVYHCLQKMDETGCDAFLDIHGDEELPFNFLAGSEGMSVWSQRLESLHGAFLASYERANPDMQAKVSYDPDKPNEGMKHICSNQIAERFDCFAGTLEMPFKEIHNGEAGWGPDRAKELGASVLDALCYVQPYLRSDEPFWESLPEEDAYIKPSSKY